MVALFSAAKASLRVSPRPTRTATRLTTARVIEGFGPGVFRVRLRRTCAMVQRLSLFALVSPRARWLLSGQDALHRAVRAAQRACNSCVVPSLRMQAAHDLRTLARIDSLPRASRSRQINHLEFETQRLRQGLRLARVVTQHSTGLKNDLQPRNTFAHRHNFSLQPLDLIHGRSTKARRHIGHLSATANFFWKASAGAYCSSTAIPLLCGKNPPIGRSLASTITREPVIRSGSFVFK